MESPHDSIVGDFIYSSRGKYARIRNRSGLKSVKLYIVRHYGI